MKLSVNFVDRGCYWKAGEEIPDDKVPAMMIRKYAVRDDAPKPSPPLASPKPPSKVRKPSKG